MTTKPRLLFVTQKVDENDDVLGFVHRWIEEITPHWSEVTVICLYEGTHHLPANVRVLSLGKERGASRVKYLARFYWYAIGNLFSYDDVFVHMNPEYLVLAGLLWRATGKKIALWYSHKSNTWKLRFAVLLAHLVFTTAPLSVTFTSPKLRFMGHGIEVAKYRCDVRAENPAPVVLTVGRVTKIKHCETLVEAAALMRAHGFAANAVIAGGPVSDTDRAYETELKGLAKKLDAESLVEFTGSIPIEDLLAWYCKADIAVNMVPTGGMDKSVLEGMAAGNLVLSSNDVFKETFGPYADRIWFKTGDAADLARKIQALWQSPDREDVRRYLTEKAGEFDVRVLVKNLSEQLQALA